ncbi:HPr-rel-A system PqqD family peptide chaperone [Massilia sp. TSP1-1-2]|uniref:HPr-rel-A system PqqD family peptide chaperone n=1 Tax=unclassified Massilia TaxID=2609279 RepID=UPI003CF2FCC8
MRMWQLRPGQTLRARRFGDETVLFNDLSGDTHLLGDSAMHLLGLLQTAPRSQQQEQLLDALCDVLGCARGPAVDADAGAVLAQLAALSLIERA